MKTDVVEIRAKARFSGWKEFRQAVVRVDGTALELMVWEERANTYSQWRFKRTRRSWVRQQVATWIALSFGRPIPISECDVKVSRSDSGELSVTMTPRWPADFSVMMTVDRAGAVSIIESWVHGED